MTYNSNPLQYWKNRTYTDAQINETCAGLNNYHAAKITVTATGNLDVIVANLLMETKQGHIPGALRIFEDANTLRLKRDPSRDISGSLILWLEDGMWDLSLSHKAPLFAFGRETLDYHTLLVPDPAFIGSEGYLEEHHQTEKITAKLPFLKREQTLFWRGTPSGVIGWENEWRRAPRASLVRKAVELKHPQIDCAFTNVKSAETHFVFGEILAELPCLEKIPFEKFFSYRYLFDVDGEHCAWRSLYQKLISHSVVFKLNSKNLQWYYPSLIPWVDYIPIRPDMTEVVELVEWLNAHPEKAEEIAENAFHKMKKITYDREVAILADTLDALFACQVK